MRVLHVSVTDKGNGAHLAGYRLHKGLLQLGVDSSMFVVHRLDDTGDETIRVYQGTANLLLRAKNIAYKRWVARELRRNKERQADYPFIHDRAAEGRRAISQMPETDLIYVHGISNFIDYSHDLPLLAQRAPVVFLLHDMDFFTGGCTHARGCERFTDRCGACPQLMSHREHDLSRRVWERKRAVFRRIRDRLHFVAPSRWIAGEARRSSLLQNFPIEVIPHGIDTEVFRSRDRFAAREVLGIPRSARVLLYVSQPVGRQEKGFAFLAEALKRAKDRDDLLLLVAGGGKLPVEVSTRMLRLGWIRNDLFLSLAYCAADIFVMPSLRETFGVTAVEAMASGTPVIAFATGGIPETVRHGVSGLLVPVGDTSALYRSIEELLPDSTCRSRMAENGRKIAVEEYSMPVHAKRHKEFCARVVSTTYRQNEGQRASQPLPSHRLPSSHVDVGAPGPEGVLDMIHTHKE